MARLVRSCFIKNAPRFARRRVQFVYNAYETPEDFEYDVNLCFGNALRYNGFDGPNSANGGDICLLADYCKTKFANMYTTHVLKFANPISMEKILVPTDINSQVGSTNHPANRSLSPNPSGANSPLPNSTPIRSVQDIIHGVEHKYSLRPLHILADWETACSNFYTELLRHPFVNPAGNKKFVFNVPVALLWPDLKASYLEKVAKPIDLTTIRCKLLHGGIYRYPDDFFEDIARLFDNAMLFNMLGNDEKDDLAMNYYEASSHLILYSRWLSFSFITGFLLQVSERSGAIVEDERQLATTSLITNYICAERRWKERHQQGPSSQWTVLSVATDNELLSGLRRGDA